MLAMIYDILRECHDAGIDIRVITTDMASEKRAIWNLLNIYATSISHNCACFQAPMRARKDARVHARPTSHAIKNFKGASIKYSVQVHPEWFFLKYNLADLDTLTNVKMKLVLENLIAIQKTLDVVLVEWVQQGFEKNEDEIHP